MTTQFDVIVPELGEFSDVPVIELLVSPGTVVGAEDPLVTLESDKAIMEVPAPCAGVVKDIQVAVGDTVNSGDVIVILMVNEEGSDSTQGVKDDLSNLSPPPEQATGKESDRGSTSGVSPVSHTTSTPINPETPADKSETPRTSAPDPRAPEAYRGNADQKRPSPTSSLPNAPELQQRHLHATPAVRRFARTLGVDLSKVIGTGRKGRLLKENVTAFVKEQLTSQSPQRQPTSAIPPIPEIDFSQFGEIETKPLSRIKRIAGTNLHRSWLNIPLVTHHDEADVTELEAFRRSLKDDAAAQGARITLLAFIFKALATTLRAFPTFNASLTPDGQSLILKKYCHLGMAVDTPNGLIVPVLKNVDQKGAIDLALEMADISIRARDRKLKPSDLEGASMSVSSLGGIGGTSFTPLVNAPEVAILGVSRTKMAPLWNGESFVPRLMLPLSLSYDHRVIDGAEGARFTAHLRTLLEEVRRLLL